MAGLRRASVSAARRVIKYVMRVYCFSVRPAEEMPRQKKQASKPVSCDSMGA